MHTHTQAEKELVLRQGKQEPTVRSHQPHHTLYYAKLGIYCTLIRNPGVGGGGGEGGALSLKVRKTLNVSNFLLWVFVQPARVALRVERSGPFTSGAVLVWYSVPQV